MTIELNDDDTRLLCTVLLQQAQEHWSYASTSEVAERLYKLATRFARPVRTTQLNDCMSAKLAMDHDDVAINGDANCQKRVHC